MTPMERWLTWVDRLLAVVFTLVGLYVVLFLYLLWLLVGALAVSLIFT